MTTDTNELALATYSNRTEIYLRFRFAYLTDDHQWLANPKDDDIPDAVVHVMDQVCCCCLHELIATGDWTQIDEMLFNIGATDNTDHSSASLLN